MEERNKITLENWNDSFDKIAKVGDLVDHEVVHQLINNVSPTTLSTDYVQCGSPYCDAWTEEQGIFRATYATFSRLDDNTWLFNGYCFKGETSDQSLNFIDYENNIQM